MFPTELPGGAGRGMLFLGGPRVDSLASLERSGMYLSDLAAHDLGRDYVLLAEQQLVDSGLRERSERLAMEMRELAKRLAEEKEALVRGGAGAGAGSSPPPAFVCCAAWWKTRAEGRR